MSSHPTQIWVLDGQGQVVAATSGEVPGPALASPPRAGSPPPHCAEVPLTNGWMAVIQLGDAVPASPWEAGATAALAEELRSAQEALAVREEETSSDKSSWAELGRQLLIANLELQAANQELERRVRLLQRRNKPGKDR